MTGYLFLGSELTADGDCSHDQKPASQQESFDKLRQFVKKKRHHFADRNPYNEDYDLSSSHVQI